MVLLKATISKKTKGKNKTAKVRINKINCSPLVANRSVFSDTCYTDDAIQKIKRAYNENHPDDPIVSTTPKDIWNELRNRLTSCKTEKCWLNQIDDPYERQQLDDILFAPEKPPEWKHDKNYWLSNFDIESVLRQYEISHPHFKLLGPTPINYDTVLKNGKCVWEELCRLNLQELWNRGKRNLGIVFNLDDHDGPGLHWTSMFVDMKRATLFYYDSALYPVPKEIRRLKNTILKQGLEMTPPIKFKYIRNRRSQQRTSSECGMYALYFIITMLTGGLLEKNIELFRNQPIPDKKMVEYRNKYFN